MTDLTVTTCSSCENSVIRTHKTERGLLCGDCYAVEILRQDIIDSRIDEQVERGYHHHDDIR